VYDPYILYFDTSSPIHKMSSAVEAAKRKADAAVTAAKDAAADAGPAVQKVKENPKQATQDFLHTPIMRAALPFINGGIAGMVATTVIQPVDMIKVRLQLAGEGIKTGPKPTPLSVTREVIAAGRVLDLYTGLSAGLLRQAVYTTARMGLFGTFMNQLTARAESQGRKIGFAERAGAGLTAGGIAAMVGNPADLALIRRWPEAPRATRKLQISLRRSRPHLSQRRHRRTLERRIPNSRPRHGAELRPACVLLRG
jgi:solute carrier family 25 oxoglutarate transporter 11